MISDNHNLLHHYELLRHQYQDRVEPLLAQLRQRIDDELSRIRQEEAELSAAQVQALLELQTAIGVDARFLLNTAQFQDFLEKFLQPQPKFDLDKPPAADKDIANWLLSQSDKPVRVFDYKENVEPDDYDDERSFTSYGFEVKVGWGDETVEVDYIRTHKMYGVQDCRCNSYAEIAEEISWRLEDFPTDERGDISSELSCLAIYCCILLAQTPPTVKFVYSSVEQEEPELWELST